MRVCTRLSCSVILDFLLAPRARGEAHPLPSSSAPARAHWLTILPPLLLTMFESVLIYTVLTIVMPATRSARHDRGCGPPCHVRLPHPPGYSRGCGSARSDCEHGCASRSGAHSRRQAHPCGGG